MQLQTPCTGRCTPSWPVMKPTHMPILLDSSALQHLWETIWWKGLKHESCSTFKPGSPASRFGFQSPRWPSALSRYGQRCLTSSCFQWKLRSELVLFPIDFPRFCVVYHLRSNWKQESDTMNYNYLAFVHYYFIVWMLLLLCSPVPPWNYYIFKEISDCFSF